MWVVLLYMLVKAEPVLINSIMALSEQECREVAELSNRLVPQTFALCQFIEQGPAT